ncbi:helix-turn-helix domain-containing protein [Culicoidibacter larvae]|uniref:HTH cro/C1-type domain-containing protein n=1 Tax=Culicoidibacter larvae TaxID=2579976 RepID=A0A5R8QI17_9FIRM|nr:Rgg/GadR/MutR family transcriptional regulator [Culicoidibacter larvae]TLG77073.1 hypothetical protein FEZ08_00210 [Culicoidibacter larvae]
MQQTNDFTKKLGATFHQIRINKRMSQTQVCADKFTQPTLANIEKGNIRTSYENCIHIANQLNIGLDELNYLVNNSKNTPVEEINSLMRGFSDAHTKERYEQIQKLCLKYYKATGNQAFKQLYKLVSARKIYIEDFDINQSRALILEIWDELKEMDKWYFFELRLLASVFLALPYESAIAVAKRAIADLETYNQIFETREIQVKFLINAALLSNMEHRYNEAIIWSKRALDFAYTNNLTSFLSGAYYQLFMSHYQNNDKSGAESALHQAIVLAFMHKHQHVLKKWRSQAKNICRYPEEKFDILIEKISQFLEKI